MRFTKNQLKNMYLEKLAECRRSIGIISVLAQMNGGKLTKEEKDLAIEGVGELRLDKLTKQDPNQLHSTTFSILTERGKEHLEELKIKGIDHKAHTLFLRDYIRDDLLYKACATSFNNDGYWDAVAIAMRHLEVRVKEKAKLPSGFGTALMTRAFKVPNGKLDVLAAPEEVNKQGFHKIMLGVMEYHRNNKMHNEGTLDRSKAMQIIGYVDYLLEIIDQAQLQG